MPKIKTHRKIQCVNPDDSTKFPHHKPLTEHSEVDGQQITIGTWSDHVKMPQVAGGERQTLAESDAHKGMRRHVQQHVHIADHPFHETYLP